MNRKMIRLPINLMIALALLFTSAAFAAPITANAQASPCGDSYVVKSGDTLSGIAVECGVPYAALLDANPKITNPRLIFPGQNLMIPDLEDPELEGVIPVTGGPYRIYILQETKTLSEIVSKLNRSEHAILEVNPHIEDAEEIEAGQRLYIPPHPAYVIPDTGAAEKIYRVERGDTLFKIAQKYNTSVNDLLLRNPQIFDRHLIFTGQRIAVPDPDADPVPSPAPVPPAGRLILQESFATTGIWFTADHDRFWIDYVDDGYRIYNDFYNSYVSSVRTFDLADVYVEVDAVRIAGPETGYYGVVSRWEDIHNYYAFVISSDGFYGIVRVEDGQPQFLAQGLDRSGLINLNDSNRIGGAIEDKTLTLYVNGEALLQVEDETFETGAVGLMVGTRPVAGVEVHFDDLHLYLP
jgi:LysM repeat protein